MASSGGGNGGGGKRQKQQPPVEDDDDDDPNLQKHKSDRCRAERVRKLAESMIKLLEACARQNDLEDFDTTLIEMEDSLDARWDALDPK